MTTPATPNPATWWQPFEVAPGRQLDCRLGTLALRLGHDRGEWLVGTRAIPEEEAEPRACLQVGDSLPEGSGTGEDTPLTNERFVHAAESNTVTLMPLLADRPVVIRPHQPVFLLSGQSITLYLSTPVWLRLLVGEPPVLLKELPVLRLSDTWFGPNTREGELSYAGRTNARHRPSELPDRPHRAITPLTIHNRADSPLPLEKISLPVPMLALYGDDTGRLWTQNVTLTRESQGDLASVKIDSKLPESGRNLTRLAEPRQEPDRSGMYRALNLLFGS